MAPMLFNLFFSLVLETWRSKMEELCPGHSVSFRFNINGNLFNRSRTSCKTSSAPDLELADDAVLITPSREAAQIALSTFADVAASFGLSVNFSKTKVMACGFNADPAPDDLLPLVINDQVVEMVDTFVYLGSLLSSSGRFSAEVDCRLAGAFRSFGVLQCVFRNRDISVNTKRLLYLS